MEANNKQEQLRQLHYDRFLAIRKESEIRESSLLPITFNICGIEVNQFTALHYIYLDFADNAHINEKKEIELEDTFQFLWVVSKEFKQNDKVAYTAFRLKYKDIEHEKVAKEIQEYLSYSILDLNNSSGESPSFEIKKLNGPTYAWIIPYIDLLAKEYGWTDEYIMNLPLARMLQYCRAIEVRMAASNGGNVTPRNKLSDPFIPKILELNNEIRNGKPNKEI